MTLFLIVLDKESEEEMESDDENQYPVIEKVVPRRKLGNSDGISDGSESDIDERELEQLLGQTKRPAMKMYADEMEEQEQARRLVNPFQTNGVFHKATYNKVRMAVIHLQFWAYGSWDSLFPISMSPNCKLMSPKHYFQ